MSDSAAMAVASARGAGRWGGELRAMLALGWPLILTNLAQIAITTTDAMMLGWLGAETLAAGTLGANLFFVCFVPGLGIAMAASPMLAQALGRGRHTVRDGRRTVRQGLWASLLLSLLAWLVLWRAETLLLLLGQDATLAAQAQIYVRGLQWSLLPALWFMVLRSFIAAHERPRAGLVVTVAGVAVNALLVWVLAFGRLGAPPLGLAGAGIASSLAHAFMFLALLGFVLIDRRFRRHYLLGYLWRPDWPKFRELMRIGLPMSVQLAFEVTVFNGAAFLMGLLGTAALAAHSIALQCASVTFMVALGLSQAATIRVGLAAGRGDRVGVGTAGWVALALGCAFMTTSAIVFIGAPEMIVGWFLDDSGPTAQAVLALASSYLAIAGVFQIADGAQAVGAGALRGLKDTRVPMAFAGLGYWGIGLPFGAALAFIGGFGGHGIWLGLAVGLGVVALMMVARWTRREHLGLVPVG